MRRERDAVSKSNRLLETANPLMTSLSFSFYSHCLGEGRSISYCEFYGRGSGFSKRLRRNRLYFSAFRKGDNISPYRLPLRKELPPVPPTINELPSSRGRERETPKVKRVANSDLHLGL